MRMQDIEIGKTYRLKSSPNYGYVKVISIHKRMTNYMRKINNIPDNLPNASLVKVEHTVDKNDSFGFIRYFSPTDLILDT